MGWRHEAAVRRRVVLAAFAVLLSVGLFLVLAEGIAEGVLRCVDEGTLRAFEQSRHGALTAAMKVITFLGGDWGVALPTVAVIGVLLVMCRPRLREALFVLTIMVGTGVLQLVTKLMFERPRPSAFAPLTVVTTYSYPSGHAMASAGLALAVAVVAWPTRWRAASVAGGAAIALLVGASRMYLGVHFPSDVIAGWLLAVAWATWVCLMFDLAGRPVGLSCAPSGRRRRSTGSDRADGERGRCSCGRPGAGRPGSGRLRGRALVQLALSGVSTTE